MRLLSMLFIGLFVASMVRAVVSSSLVDQASEVGPGLEEVASEISGVVRGESQVQKDQVSTASNDTAIVSASSDFVPAEQPLAPRVELLEASLGPADSSLVTLSVKWRALVDGPVQYAARFETATAEHTDLGTLEQQAGTTYSWTPSADRDSFGPAGRGIIAVFLDGNIVVYFSFEEEDDNERQ